MWVTFTRLVWAMSALILIFGAVPSQAQSYPSKPIRWVVAYPPGGGTDLLARLVGSQLSKQMGQPVVIENRPGGAGFIASEAVARSPGDGHTIFTGDNGTLVYNSALFKRTPYDAVKDFAAVGLMARFPLVLLANANSPFATASQMIETGKRRPGQLNYGSPGLGSPHHLAMELLKQKAGLFIVHVPYKGSGPALQDLIGGTLELFVADTAAALPMIRSGKVKALAVFSKSRMTALPEIPTFIELGFEGVEAYGWQALVVPASTPKDIVSKLNAELIKAIQAPEVAPKLIDFGLELIPSDPPTMTRYLADETRLWHELIRERKITLE